MSYKCTFEIPFQSYRLLLGMKSLRNLEVLDVKTHQNMPINNAIEYFSTVCKMVVHAYDLFLEIQHLYKLSKTNMVTTLQLIANALLKMSTFLIKVSVGVALRYAFHCMYMHVRTMTKNQVSHTYN